MIFRQFMLDDLQSAAYMVGDQDAGVVAMIDPHLDVDSYLDAAAMYGVRIDHVLETHTHADRVSGHGILAELGATVHIHRVAGVEYPHEPFEDGWSLRLGRVEIRAMHTPGHRPEHTAFVVIDHARGDEPWAVLTGDSLFVSDIARPDLAIDGRDGARDLFHSLHEGLLTLPDTTEVWPGHVGGSLCGGPSMAIKGSSTIGFERDHNPLLQETDAERFVAAMTANLPPRPGNLERIVALNHGPLRGAPAAASAIDIETFQGARGDGVVVVDARPSTDFDAGHIEGSISIPASTGGFANRLAWLTTPEERVLVVGEGDRDGRRAAELAASVGRDSVSGYLAGGLSAWIAAGGATQTTERLPAARVEGERAANPDLQLIDVRDAHEVVDAPAPTDAAVPYYELRSADIDLDPSRPVAVICASGQRAGIAASVLKARGFTQSIHVTEGGVSSLGARTAAPH